MTEIKVSIPVSNDLLAWYERNGVDITALMQAEIGKALKKNMREFNAELERWLIRGSSRTKAPKGILNG